MKVENKDYPIGCFKIHPDYFEKFNKCNFKTEKAFKKALKLEASYVKEKFLDGNMDLKPDFDKVKEIEENLNKILKTGDLF